MAALEFVELSVAVRICLATCQKPNNRLRGGFLVEWGNKLNNKNMAYFNKGISAIGIIISLVITGLLVGGLYFYFQKQIPGGGEIIEKQAKEETGGQKPEEENNSSVNEQIEEEGDEIVEQITPKVEEKAPEINKPELEITARRTETSGKNLPFSKKFNISLALAEYQEFKKGEELQVEIRIAPPKEITNHQTWVVGYTIKNTTDFQFALTYDIGPSFYKTSGAVVVDPDGQGQKEDFYYGFGEEVLLQPNSEQYFDVSFSPPNDLTQINPKVVFNGFSTKEPLFVHEFTVKINLIQCDECKKPVCLEGQDIWDTGGVDDCMCPIYNCVLAGVSCATISPEGVCVEVPLNCEEIGIGEGWTIVSECPK